LDICGPRMDRNIVFAAIWRFFQVLNRYMQKKTNVKFESFSVSGSHLYINRCHVSAGIRTKKTAIQLKIQKVKEHKLFTQKWRETLANWSDTSPVSPLARQIGPSVCLKQLFYEFWVLLLGPGIGNNVDIASNGGSGCSQYHHMKRKHS
jgi:hypothetical protein